LVAQSLLTPTAPLAVAIFLATIVLVIVRPWRLTEAYSALLGAGAMVIAGLVSPLARVRERTDPPTQPPRKDSVASTFDWSFHLIRSGGQWLIDRLDGKYAPANEP
jgi:hypothetical protein